MKDVVVVVKGNSDLIVRSRAVKSVFEPNAFTDQRFTKEKRCAPVLWRNSNLRFPMAMHMANTLCSF